MGDLLAFDLVLKDGKGHTVQTGRTREPTTAGVAFLIESLARYQWFPIRVGGKEDSFKAARRSFICVVNTSPVSVADTLSLPVTFPDARDYEIVLCLFEFRVRQSAVLPRFVRLYGWLYGWLYGCTRV